MFYGMLGVVLGGRFGYVLFYAFGTFLADPLLLFRIKEGGMSFHGGLLGVMVALCLVVAAQRLHFFDTMDFVAPLVPIGLGLGRSATSSAASCGVAPPTRRGRWCSRTRCRPVLVR
jgi:phosphatidylglycerol---prolipoprotein diacylglyceryl transferase